MSRHRKKAKKKGDDEDKAIKNLLASIDERRSLALNRFLFALGIRHIGESTAKALAKRFPDLPSLMQALAAAAAAQAGPDWLELSAVPRVGPTTRDRLLEFGFVGEAEGSEVGTGRRPTTAQRANLIAPLRRRGLRGSSRRPRP